MVSRFFSSLFFSILVLFVVAQDPGADRTSLGKISDSRLNELSGIIGSFKNPDMFWTHNDSGDSARIFLIDSKARLRTVVSLQGIDAVDTEDIARYEQNGKSFLVLADIGDNRGVRKDIQLYVFEEPKYVEGKNVLVIPRAQIKCIRLNYADNARDAEALFIDPLDLKGYLISKRELRVGVYPFDVKDAKDGDAQVLHRMTSLPMTFITAADISKDGKRVLLKNLGQVFLWQRRDEEPIAELLKHRADTVNYQAEAQGEAICFGKQSDVFYTVSERPMGLESHLYKYQLSRAATDVLSSF